MNKQVVNVVIDTDTYNEVDDQFAIVYGLLSKERVSIKAFHAAPFFNKNSLSPEDGMYQSFAEINRILHILNIDKVGKVYLGSKKFLESESKFEESDAARHLIDLVMQSEERIYVVAIAALTNVASAILMNPKIINRMTVIWLGGHDYSQVENREFNLRQDIAAAKIVFNSNVDLVHIPCNGVISNLVLTQAELEKFIDGKNEIGTYLTTIFRQCNKEDMSYARIISDVAAMAYLVLPEALQTIQCPRPDIDYNLKYNFNHLNALETKVVSLHRNKIIDDLLRKIACL